MLHWNWNVHILFKILGLNCQFGQNHASVKCRYLSPPPELGEFYTDWILASKLEGRKR